jgi:hypothetical protein
MERRMIESGLDYVGHMQNFTLASLLDQNACLNLTILAWDHGVRGRLMKFCVRCKLFGLHNVGQSFKI